MQRRRRGITWSGIMLMRASSGSAASVDKTAKLWRMIEPVR